MFTMLWIILILAVLVGLLFVFFILPLWALIHCALSEQTTKFKVIWIIAMVLVWPLGSFLYGIFASRKKILQVLSGISLGLLIGLIFALLSILTWVSKTMITQINLRLENFQKINTTELIETQVNELKLNLADVKTSISKLNVITYKSNFKDLHLGELFEYMAADNVITKEEFEDWQRIFSVHGADENMLNSYLGKYKQRRLMNSK